jgi:hypothetical protein
MKNPSPWSPLLQFQSPGRNIVWSSTKKNKKIVSMFLKEILPQILSYLNSKVQFVQYDSIRSINDDLSFFLIPNIKLVLIK